MKKKNFKFWSIFGLLAIMVSVTFLYSDHSQINECQNDIVIADAEIKQIEVFLQKQDIQYPVLEKFLTKFGCLGDSLYQYLLFIDDSNDSNDIEVEKLNNVINYHYFSLNSKFPDDLEGINYHYGKIADFQKRFQVFENDDFSLNLSKYYYFYANKIYKKDIYKKAEFTEILRNIIIDLNVNRINEYVSWVSTLKKFQQKKELSYWFEKLNKKFCGDDDIFGKCRSNFSAALHEYRRENNIKLEDISENSVCKALIVYNNSVYLIKIC